MNRPTTGGGGAPQPVVDPLASFNFVSPPTHVTSGGSGTASAASAYDLPIGLGSYGHHSPGEGSKEGDVEVGGDEGDEAGGGGEDGGPKKKRKLKSSAPRTSRACLLCRKQKMRCEGADDPPCKRCRANNQECHFERRSDYLLHPQDSAWQTKIESRLDHLTATVSAILTALQASGVVVTLPPPPPADPPAPSSSSGGDDPRGGGGVLAAAAAAVAAATVAGGSALRGGGGGGSVNQYELSGLGDNFLDYPVPQNGGGKA